MELLNRFPKGFFRIPSEISKSSNNPDDKIIPIKWKKEKNKDKIIVNSVKKTK